MKFLEGDGGVSGADNINNRFEAGIETIENLVCNIFRIKSSAKEGKFINDTFNGLHIGINITSGLGEMFEFVFELFNVVTRG